ncbi:cysteine-rich DPF motif domain-containing protein 1 [Ctenodactylus gundi]
MASGAERCSSGVFECQLCALTAPYSYVGQKPPNTQSVVLLEESYVMKDPFSPDRDRFLVLGARCSICGRLVCVGPECSLFYSKRFCLPCVREHISAFPWEIRQDLEKRKDPPQRPSGQPCPRTLAPTPSSLSHAKSGCQGLPSPVGPLTTLAQLSVPVKSTPAGPSVPSGGITRTVLCVCLA